jgi:SAM-dependent methyltransferase
LAQRNVNKIIATTSCRRFYTGNGSHGNSRTVMLRNHAISGLAAPPSAWVERFLPLIRPSGLVLDLAAGAGQHVRLLRAHDFRVRAVDRDIVALRAFDGPDCQIVEADLEAGTPWPLGRGYDGIVVTNYLHRPLLPEIGRALAPGGVVIYETFAQGNERFGRPSNPDFLLRPGELLEAFAGLTIVAFEQGKVCAPRAAVIQRIAAVAGPLGRLPTNSSCDRRGFTPPQADARRAQAS